MNRREFITLLGGAAVAWPIAARAQQPERMRRIGVLMGAVANGPEGQARIAAFQQGLQQLGWTEGRNVRIDIRWPAAGNADDIRRYAAELVALAPDVILATGSISMAPLLQMTRAVPIVFVRSLTRSAAVSSIVCAARRQRYRVYEFRIWPQCEMAGTAQADRAGRDARGGPA